MLQTKTKEQKAYIEEVLKDASIWWWDDEEENDGIFIDDLVSFDEMAEIVDYLRNQKRMSNPDVPDRAVIKQLLIENGKLKSEVQYLENELANKNKAIKAFKKWQVGVTQRNIQEWLNEAVNLEKPILSIEVANKIKNLTKIGNSIMSHRNKMISFAQTIKSLLQDDEIQELLKDTEEE